MSAAMAVGICGLGPMGGPIAERLVSSGGPITVWNRTGARSAPFSALGATVAATPAEAAEPIVLTVLPDLPSVQEILDRPDGLLAGWAQRGITDPTLVIHGTTSPTATAAFAERLRDLHGVTVVDAPLSGGTVGASAGTLSVMVGGTPESAVALEPLFARYGRTVRYFGRSGSGALAKACNQIVVAATVSAISESLSLADRGGLDRAAVIEILEGGLAASEVLRQKKTKWIDDDFSEGGSALNQLKDLRFVESAAQSFRLELPVTDAVRDLFVRMVERGDGSLDHTGVVRTVAAGRAEGRAR